MSDGRRRPIEITLISLIRLFEQIIISVAIDVMSPLVIAVADAVLTIEMP